MLALWKAIESYGIDPAPLFLKEGIRVQLPLDPNTKYPYEKIDRIRAKAVEITGDEAFGIRSVSRFEAPHLGALGYAWQASLTLRRACSRIERFVRVVSSKAVVKVTDQDRCMAVTMSMDVPTAAGFARDDGALALITKMCRSIVGEDFRLDAVNFVHGTPRDIKPYFEFFACELNFNQAANQLLIPQEFADKTLMGANPELALLSDQVVMRRLAQLDREDIVARVRATLMDQLPTGNFSDDSVAENLFMSVRTMHRKLTEQGHNFRTLLVELRRSLAEMYIMDNSLTLTEISMLLGFSEPSSFSRAFKNWTGSAPSEVRLAHSESG